MDDQNKNLILATGLSFLVILVWFVLFPPPEPTPAPVGQAVEATAGDTALTPPAATGDAASTAAAPAADAVPAAPRA